MVCSKIHRPDRQQVIAFFVRNRVGYCWSGLRSETTGFRIYGACLIETSMRMITMISPTTTAHHLTSAVHNDTIYSVKQLRINYITYDVRRDQDVFKISRQSNVTVLAPPDLHETGSRFWYARVIGIFHTMVSPLGSWTPRFSFVVHI